ncbi:hypothetical protein CY34DRAFT_442127 [Suillus luteus UH-Slu-Lm8-n1]|uniref:Uncharacterized protein n=1 Tax=Suillus luteus UH-Slu-Lm8-n1 TaxID=930992 RepID=A0A0D0AHZ8_9AGAM|nr:hypothetical protein CY34DRAFT_442127 [Suillus luteus UH-Slu-Lm8-n1]
MSQSSKRIFCTTGSNIAMTDVSQSRSYGRDVGSMEMQGNAWISFIQIMGLMERSTVKKMPSAIKKICSDADFSHHVAIEICDAFLNRHSGILSKIFHVTDQDAANPLPSGAAAELFFGPTTSIRSVVPLLVLNSMRLAETAAASAPG